MKRSLAVAALLFAVAANGDDQCGHSSALACPNGAAAALTAADCSSFDGSRYDIWEFSGEAGQTVTIALSSASFDAFLILIDPDDVPRAISDDVSSTNRDASITFTLTRSGTWMIAANSLSATGSGDYFISLDSPSCAVPGPRRRSVRR